MDVEMQAPDRDTAIPENKAKARIACWIVGALAIAFIVITACIMVPIIYYSKNTQYSVAIDSVSGLDPATGLSFNLTLAVTSRSHGAKACVYPGMYAQVFYHGVQLASSEDVTHRTCARPRSVAQLPVAAKAIGVPLGQVLERLEADMRRGTAVFDVRLGVPAGSYGGIPAMASWLTPCNGARVGGAAVMCESPDQS